MKGSDIFYESATRGDSEKFKMLFFELKPTIDSSIQAIKKVDPNNPIVKWAEPLLNQPESFTISMLDDGLKKFADYIKNNQNQIRKSKISSNLIDVGIAALELAKNQNVSSIRKDAMDVAKMLKTM